MLKGHFLRLSQMTFFFIQTAIKKRRIDINYSLNAATLIQFCEYKQIDIADILLYCKTMIRPHLGRCARNRFLNSTFCV